MLLSWPAVLICLGSGILAAYFQVWLFTAVLVAIAVMTGLMRPQTRRQLAAAGGVALAGIMIYVLNVPPFPADLEEQAVVKVIGRVASIPYFNGDKTVFMVETNNRSPYRQWLRVVCLFPVDFHRGDRVYLEGRLKPPRPPGNPGQFDFPRYLFAQGVYYNLTVSDSANTHLVEAGRGPLIWMDSLRSQAEDVTRQALPQAEAAILLGMIWGGRADMDDQQYEDFQNTGIVHIFSVGGLHVGFLLLFINMLASLAGLGNRGRFVSGIAALLVYGTMVAWPPPVIRAVLMGVLGLVAYLSGRENGLLNALSIAGIIMLLVNPASLFDLSFQLTMLATGGLVYLFPKLRSLLPGSSWIKDIALLPVCAEIAILPLIAYHFNIFTPCSLLTNIATTYLAGAAVILGFTASILAPFSFALAALFLQPAGMFIDLIVAVVDWIKDLPGAYLYVASPSMVRIGLYYALIALALLSLQMASLRKLFKPALGILLIWLVVLVIPPGFHDRDELEMVFIDVGQGDSIFIKTPGGKTVLVDGGGSQLFDVGRKVVLPYLHHRGIRSLDLVISTHADIDHLQGLVRVVDAMPVRQLGIPAALANDEGYRPLRDLAAEKNIPTLYLEAGQSLRVEEGMQVEILNPPKQAGGDDANEESVVLSISHGSYTALLTGDVSAARLALMGERLDPVTILKIPHHGSKGSLARDFYQKTDPAWAVISVGADNPFGHPHPLVVAALQESGARILRTDLQGAITIFSNGYDYHIQTHILNQP